MMDKLRLRQRALALIAENGLGVAGRLAAGFALSRQVANHPLQTLLRRGQVTALGNTRARCYRLTNVFEEKRSYVCAGLREDIV